VRAVFWIQQASHCPQRTNPTCRFRRRGFVPAHLLREPDRVVDAGVPIIDVGAVVKAPGAGAADAWAAGRERQNPVVGQQYDRLSGQLPRDMSGFRVVEADPVLADGRRVG
jgi:hypothetical protein